MTGILKTAAALLSLSVTAVLDDSCDPGLEVMYVQDVSSSISKVVWEMMEVVSNTMEGWKLMFDNVRMGYASFSDKPIPLRGWGPRQACTVFYDWCYILGSPLTDSVRDLTQALSDSPTATGGDYPENPYEAMLYSAIDPDVNWTPVSDDAKIKRVMIVITDDMPHYAGDAKLGIDIYNAPRYPSGGYGGWGNVHLADYTASLCFGGTGQGKNDYFHMCSLMYSNDSGSLTESEIEELNTLAEAFQPSSWPEATPHDGVSFDADFATGTCMTRDYPTLDQIYDALSKFNITPVFLFNIPLGWISDEAEAACSTRFGLTVKDLDTSYDCLAAIYEKDLQDAGFTEYYVGRFEDFDKLSESLVDSVAALVPDECKPSTLRPTNTTTTTPTPRPTTSTISTTTTPRPTTEQITNQPSTTTIIDYLDEDDYDGPDRRVIIVIVFIVLGILALLLMLCCCGYRKLRGPPTVLPSAMNDHQPGLETRAAMEREAFQEVEAEMFH